MNIETLLPWGKPKEVSTRNGPRILRRARPDETFWQVWRTQKEELKAGGVSVSADLDAEAEGKYWVNWWAELPSAVQAARIQSFSDSRATDTTIELPRPEGLNYMPFQKAGIVYALRCFGHKVPGIEPFPHAGGGCLIGDDMGLGKSVQACGVINADPNIQRVLFVTTKSMTMTIYRELRKWLVRKLSIGIGDSQHFPSTDIVVINYHGLLKHKKRLEFFWDLVVCDEVQNIANRKNLISRVVIGYRPTRAEKDKGMEPTSGIPAKRRLALTGTPISNRHEELWSVLNFCDPEKFKSFWSFASEFCGTSAAIGNYDTKQSVNGDRLNKMLRENLMIRRLKKDVLLDLPPKTRVIIDLPTDGCEAVLLKERTLWGNVGEFIKTAISQAGEGMTFEQAVGKIGKVAAVPFHEISALRHETALAKVPASIEQIREELESTSKIIVFAWHRDCLEALAKAFPGRYVMVHGGTAPHERDRAVQAFQKEEWAELFFGTLAACGEGLTLTAASTVIMHESDWVPGRMNQAESRAHRIGQRDNVLVKYLTLPGSIDARVLPIIIAKQELIDKALDNQKP